MGGVVLLVSPAVARLIVFVVAENARTCLKIIRTQCCERVKQLHKSVRKLQKVL